MAQYYLNFIELVGKSLVNKEAQQKSLTFFRSDNVTLEIFCKILINYYNNKPTFIEEIIKEATYGSRVTIKKKVDDAIALKYLAATKSEVDKRKNVIVPSNETIQEFESYVDQIKNSLI